MKIKSLKIKNINSFYGEFEINFENFYNDIFLISGPTGSGKTTIIDSILAALYNKTPRLSHTRDLINKNSKDAMIELVFEIRGDEYKIKLRGKKRPKSVEVKRVLFINGEERADKEKEIDLIIRNVLKLSFSEFTKAIVLAQGRFDAFLSAKSDEKIKLLENILDVREFEKISVRVFEAYREIEKEIGEIKTKIDEIEADEEMLSEKLKELEFLQKELNYFQEEYEKNTKKYERFKEKKRLLEENSKLLKDIQNLKDRLLKLDIKKYEEKYIKTKKRFKKSEEDFRKKTEFLDEEIKKEIFKKTLVENRKKAVERKKKGEKLINSISEKNISLESEISEIKKKIKNINIIEDEALKNFNEVSWLFRNLKILKDRYKSEVAKLKDLKTLQSKKEETLKTIQNKKLELEEKKEYLEAKLVVLQYENKRKNLKEGYPCPLCGSVEHPYVKNPPKIKEDVKKEYEDVVNHLEKIQKEEEKLKNEISVKGSLIEKYKTDIDEIVKEGKELRKELKKFGLREEDFEELKRKKEHNEKSQKEISELNVSLEKKKTELEKNRENILLYKNEIERIKNEIEKIDFEISKIVLKTENPFFVKEQIKSEFEKEKMEFEKTEKEFFEKKEEFSKLSTSLNEKEKRYKQNLEKIESIKIEDENFKERLDSLKKRINELNIKKGESLKETEYIKKELEKRDNLLKIVKEKEKRYIILSKLNKAIGSRDGKKFKQIAISKMIDGLLYAANVHLENLSEGRYFLIKGDELSKIELDIVDTFYENKKRSVNTLSGGEKFLVSLSLAFALSDLIRDKVKIDFMFLDEGFGTLDGYNLFKTLEILKKASTGKTIGIISHIDALKEEINKGIKVKKAGGGKSKIEIFY